MNEHFLPELGDRIQAKLDLLDYPQTKAAELIGVDQSMLSRLVNKKHVNPRTNNLFKLLDWLGCKILFAEQDSDISRNLCFIPPKVQGGKNLPLSSADEYIAVPIIAEADAGPDLIEKKIKNWFLLNKSFPAVRGRKNLVAVEIGKDSFSMSPTFAPEDIVLINRDDKTCVNNRLMLVLNPKGECAKIRRVKIENTHDGDTILAFLADNKHGHWMPEAYSLKKDFDNNWDKAVIGRVIWAWSDFSNR